MDPLELAGILHLDLQKIIGSPRHQKALLDLGVTPDSRLETVEVFFRLPLQRNVDDDGNRALGLTAIEEDRIATDDATFLK